MRVLGIETSCDETAAAVVEDGVNVISSVVASSQELHTKYGGIVPEIAAREQVSAAIPVIHEALEKAFINLRAYPAVGGRSREVGNFFGPTPWADRLNDKKFRELVRENISAIAVTQGPGLVGSLIVGVETAKILSWVWKKPLIPVNHLLAHIYGAFLSPRKDAINRASIINTPNFPLIALIVSGGHTDLLLMESHTNYKWLGGTRDDAAGEAFDKAARLLGLGYPGGPAIAQAAETNTQKRKNGSRLPQCGIRGARTVELPRPMINTDNFDFSFAGLKTALRRSLSLSPTANHTAYLAHEFQEAVTDVLVKKTISAGKKYNVTTIVLCGGVSANKTLREKMKISADNLGFKLFIPDFQFSTDNAAMIASRAYFTQCFIEAEKLEADPGLLF